MSNILDNAPLEPGSMGRLAILIAEVRSLRAGAAALDEAAGQLAAEVRHIHDMQLTTLNMMADLIALFSTPPEAEPPPIEMPDESTPEAAAATKEKRRAKPTADAPAEPVTAQEEQV